MTEKVINLVNDDEEYDKERDHQVDDNCSMPGCKNESVAEIINDEEDLAGNVIRQHHHVCDEHKEDVLDSLKDD